MKDLTKVNLHDFVTIVETAHDIARAGFGDEDEGYNHTLEARLVARWLGHEFDAEHANNVTDMRDDPQTCGRDRDDEWVKATHMFDLKTGAKTVENRSTR